MDIKKTTIAQADTKQLARVESAQRNSRPERADASVSSTEVSSSQKKPEVDTGATMNLIELGRREVEALHERMLTRLREDIASGDYSANMDVVAERVAEVLSED